MSSIWSKEGLRKEMGAVRLTGETNGSLKNKEGDMSRVNQQNQHKGQLSQKKYRELAMAQYHVDGEIEIDEGATVSISQDKGAYVQAWVWVDDPQKEGD